MFGRQIVEFVTDYNISVIVTRRYDNWFEFYLLEHIFAVGAAIGCSGR